MGFEFQVNKGLDSWARIDCKLFSEEGFVEGVISDVSPNRLQLIELKRLNEELDRFIYHASHDLRSPLTTLLGLINLVEIDKQIELGEYCRLMRDRVNYLDDLLRDMAAIVADSRDDVKYEMIEFNTILKKIQHELRITDGSLSIAFMQHGEKLFYSDKSRIESIFRYLILFTYSSQKLIPRELVLTVSASMLENSILLKFSDNGNGLNDTQVQRVFGMFFKPDSEVRQTGLGLYIAKHIVEKLGGTIELKSKIGIGTEFQIELPVLSADTNPQKDSATKTLCKGKRWGAFCEICKGFVGACRYHESQPAPLQEVNQNH